MVTTYFRGTLGLKQTIEKKKQISAVSFPVYVLKALTWCATILVLIRYIAPHHLLLFAATVFMLSIPVATGGIYRSTIRKIRLLSFFSNRGIIARILSGRIFPTLFWVFYAVVSSFFMAIGFQFFHIADWILFFSVIPVFYLVHNLFYRFLSKEIKSYLVTSISMTCAVVCTPFLMLMIHALFMVRFGMPVFLYENLGSAINASDKTISGPAGSALIQAVSEWMIVYNSIRSYVAGNFYAGEIALSSIIYLILAGYVIFFSAANLLTFCLVPVREFKRILLPLSPDPVIPFSRTHARKGMVFLTGIFASLLLIATVFIFMEMRFSMNAKLSEHNDAVRQKVIACAERIDDIYVKPGTITQIKAHKLDLMVSLDDSVLKLEASIDHAFDDMILRVDDYLDWHYSLFGEYGRIAHMIRGHAAEHLSTMMAKHLNIDENFKHINNQADHLLRRHNEITTQFRQTSHALLEKNKIDSPDDNITISNVSHMDALLNYENFSGFDFRMLLASTTSGGGFLAGGVAGKKLIDNILKRSVLKASARTLAKLGTSRAVGKSGGGTAGAAAGAAVGSFIPGGGTVIGAVAGGITGAVAGGLMMDKGLLMAEEYYSREDFKAQIVYAIEKVRAETKAGLYGM